MGYVKDWSNVKATGRNRLTPSDLWEIYKIPAKLKPVRPVGPVAVMATHWIEFKNKDGELKRAGIPCPAFDPETESCNPEIRCPACEQGLRVNIRYFVNVIVRSLQKGMRKYLSDAPHEKDLPFLTLDQEHFTPVKVLIIPVSVMRQIRELEEELNVVKGEVYPVTHKKYGRDLLIRFDPNKAGSEMYHVSLSANHTPLNKEERKYKLWDLSQIEQLIGDPEENAKRIEELLGGAPPKGKKVKSGLEEDDDEDDDDITIPEDEDMEDEDLSEDDEYEDEEDEEDLDELEEQIYEMSRKELLKFMKERGIKKPKKIKLKKMSDEDLKEYVLEKLGII